MHTGITPSEQQVSVLRAVSHEAQRKFSASPPMVSL